MNEPVSETGQALEAATWPLLYPGTVVDDDDPLRTGRVRVRVDQVYGATAEDEFIPDAQLPWARVICPAIGAQTGGPWIPPTHAPVVVGFWGGDAAFPFVFGGGWMPDAKVPPEFASSYDNGPKTRLVKTEGGQVFEMRWKAGEKHTHFTLPSGIVLDLIEDPALGGPKVRVATPLGQTVILDDVAAKVTIQTPGQLEAIAGTTASLTVGGALTATIAGPATITSGALLKLSAASIEFDSTGPAVTNTAGPTTNTFTGIATLIFLAALNWTLAGLWAVTGAGAIAFTVAGNISMFGAAVLLGGVGALRLLNETYHAVHFLPHTHLVSTAPGVTGPVNGAPPLVPATATSITKAA